MRGMTTAPVTLLEEKKILSSSTIVMTARTRRTGCSSPTPESVPQAIQRAAPVLARSMPAEMPPAMRMSPPQSMLREASFQSSKTRRPGRNRRTKPNRATKASGALKPIYGSRFEPPSHRKTIVTKTTRVRISLTFRPPRAASSALMLSRVMGISLNSGLKSFMRQNQPRGIMSSAPGTPTAIHCAKETSSCAMSRTYCMARTFAPQPAGVAVPPMREPQTMPIMRARPKLLSKGLQPLP